jgi:hypothetical protein
MPNVRIDVLNKTTGQITRYTPVVLTQPRRSFRLLPGKTIEFDIYHRGINPAAGENILTISLFKDEDLNQETPIASLQLPLLTPKSALSTQTTSPTLAYPVSELSGILFKDEKTIEQYYLILDGSNDKCYVRTEPMNNLNAMVGKRVRIKGILKSYLFEDLTNYSAPQSPAPPPFKNGWIIFINIIEIQAISQPFASPKN